MSLSTSQHHQFCICFLKGKNVNVCGSCGFFTEYFARLGFFLWCLSPNAAKSWTPAFAQSAIMSCFTSNAPQQPTYTKSTGNKTVSDSSVRYHFTFFFFSSYVGRKGKFFSSSVEYEKKETFLNFWDQAALSRSRGDKRIKVELLRRVKLI